MQYFTLKTLFLPVEIQNLHVMRHGISLLGIVHMMRDLAVETSKLLEQLPT